MSMYPLIITNNTHTIDLYQTSFIFLAISWPSNMLLSIQTKSNLGRLFIFLRDSKLVKIGYIFQE